VSNVPRTVKGPSISGAVRKIVELLRAQPEPSDCLVVEKIGRRSTHQQNYKKRVTFGTFSIHFSAVQQVHRSHKVKVPESGQVV